MSEKPVLFTYFEDLQQLLWCHYLLSKQQNASNNLGKNREFFCQDFLKKILPNKLCISSGEIWDSQHCKTGQLDLIISREDMPSLYVGSENIYLIEGVLSVIEVKSNLTREKLCEAGNSLAKLAKQSPVNYKVISSGHQIEKPLRIVFAYESASWKTLGDEIVKRNWTDLFDLICVLNRGVLVKKGGLLKGDDINPWYIKLNTGASALGFLYYYLVNYGSSFLGRNITLNEYFDPFNTWIK